MALCLAGAAWKILESISFPYNSSPVPQKGLLLSPRAPHPTLRPDPSPVLQALVPVTIEVEVPYDLHRYIIGQKGSGIRKMMDEFEVQPLCRSSPRTPGAGKGVPCSCTLRELSSSPPPSSSRG